MAKRPKRRGESIMGYFRPFFDADKNLINSKSNEQLIDRWKQDHPGHSDKLLKKVKQNLANLKSMLRRKLREAGGKPSFRKGAKVSFTNAVGTPTMAMLEEQIDDCMVLAHNIDRKRLDNVIKNLRAARNEVVLKNG
jgi:hypothetical protein